MAWFQSKYPDYSGDLLAWCSGLVRGTGSMLVICIALYIPITSGIR